MQHHEANHTEKVNSHLSQNPEVDSSEETTDLTEAERALLQASYERIRKCTFVFFASGLIISFVLWGIFQEQIMTVGYPPDNALFVYSLVCILGNRMAAMIVSGLTLVLTQQPTHSAPIYVYLYPSVSNLISTYCQYEALKHIDFITQVLMKSAKIIPVMIMGVILSRRRYTINEYICAMSISFGTGLFLIASDNEFGGGNNQELSIYGLFLMFTYVIFDSFTSTIQSKLYEQYSMSTHQMMFYVNVVSTPSLLIGLSWDNYWVDALSFIRDHPSVLYDLSVLSLSGAIGQNFIYATIKEFGAVSYSVIMTIRQLISIVSSDYIFSHDLGILQWTGLSAVFFGLFLHVQASKNKRPHSQPRTRELSPTPQNYTDSKA